MISIIFTTMYDRWSASTRLITHDNNYCNNSAALLLFGRGLLNSFSNVPPSAHARHALEHAARGKTKIRSANYHITVQYPRLGRSSNYSLQHAISLDIRGLHSKHCGSRVVSAAQ